MADHVKLLLENELHFVKHLDGLVLKDRHNLG